MENRPNTNGSGPSDKKGSPSAGRPRLNPSTWWVLLFVGLVIFLMFISNGSSRRSEISYSFFRQQLEKDNIAEVEYVDHKIYGRFKSPPADPNSKTSQQGKPAKLRDEFVVVLSPLVNESLDEEILKKVPKVRSREATDTTAVLLIAYVAIPLLLFAGIWIMFRRARDQFAGGGFLGGFSKSPAKRYEASKQRITFADVAGLEGVKTELEEIVEFLKNPERFQRLGGRIPKGILLMGPPGTGKTLLAKAVAGEAGVPFFSISGSEFIQMFVGVGASRVRDLFKTAKENAPCILFIDEIDAVGRVRGAGLGGGHDEREQTLNQILSEMDGFTPTESVIVLAATNRPDVLDPALLRPGRFDRHITVDRPNLKGRLEIFKVHTRNVPLADDVDLESLARGTVGLTGADIRNLVNEAALLATRFGKDKVEMSDFEQARDKVLMGPKREELLTGKEKEMTAYHEAGHALLAWIVDGVDRVHKVTIIPRGRALGVTQLLPEEDRLSVSEHELHARLVFMMGGRAAEKLIFNEYSAGAENDLKQATDIARRMVTRWGMSERVGPVMYRLSEEHPFLGKEIHEQREFSEHSAQIIDEEVSHILHAASARAMQLLTKHRDRLERLAKALCEHETLDEQEIAELIGPSARQLAKSNGRVGIESPTDADGDHPSPAPRAATGDGEPSGCDKSSANDTDTSPSADNAPVASDMPITGDSSPGDGDSRRSSS